MWLNEKRYERKLQPDQSYVVNYERKPDCYLCGGSHFIRECPKLAEAQQLIGYTPKLVDNTQLETHYNNYTNFIIMILLFKIPHLFHII